MFLPCERANRRNFHHVCTVPVVTGGPLCAGNHTHPQLINNSQINFLRCICLFSSPSLSMYSIYSKTLSFSSPFLVHFYISSIVFCYLFPAIHQLYCILILPFTDAALGLLWFPYMNPFLCLPLCRMISTEPSSGLTQPCLTRWWYSSARWSVSCLHGGYPHCWHWTERGGREKKERRDITWRLKRKWKVSQLTGWGKEQKEGEMDKRCKAIVQYVQKRKDRIKNIPGAMRENDREQRGNW